MGLRYVVVTSVDRDDLADSGAEHFSNCISEIRKASPKTQIEILTPDFRGRMDIAVKTLALMPPDVFNHNLETVPRLYKEARPGADYQYSLDLLKAFKENSNNVATKSGLMLGLGEEIPEVEAVMEDLRAHKVNMLTLGQYLQPSRDHLAVKAYIHPDEFDRLAIVGKKMGFKHVASGPMVRSSYHADKQFEGEKVG
jgi:lipoic acid synthetase